MKVTSEPIQVEVWLLYDDWFCLSRNAKLYTSNTVEFTAVFPLTEIKFKTASKVAITEYSFGVNSFRNLKQLIVLPINKVTLTNNINPYVMDF